jgi:ABC-type nitrate/sulfonate/bicarbonate transport system permease component
MASSTASKESRTAMVQAASARARRNQKWEGLVLSVGTFIVVTAIWELAWQVKLISPLFFSGPSAIVVKFVELLANGKLLSNVAYSGTNYLIGLALAVVCGVPIGVALGWYRRIQLAFNPLITALYATPRIALYPLIIIWFGIGSGSKVFIVFISAVLPIIVNTIAGVRNIDPDLLRAARAYCATDRQIFTTVALPYSVPFVLTGVRQAVAHGLIGVIIAEITAGSEGVGYMIAYAGQMFATDELMVGVIVTALAGVLITSIADRLQRHFQRWRPEHVGGR